MQESDFIRQQSGAVFLNDAGRRKFFKHWQEKKQETLMHPYLAEKLPWGMIPYVQAQLLARYIRSDLDAAGRKRLRQIAKQCVNYGQRVQCSVFECLLDAAQCRSLQAKLCSIMDMEKDSLRFYYLGNRYQSKIDHFGCKSAYMPEDPILL